MSFKIFHNFFNQLKNAAIINNTFVDVFITKDIYECIKFFFEKGFINTYLQLFANKIRIFLNYFKFYSVFATLEVYLKTYTKFELKQYLYNYKQRNNSLYLLKTIDGLCTIDELFLYKKNKTGVILCKIQY